jgi:hypothetical protein
METAKNKAINYEPNNVVAIREFLEQAVGFVDYRLDWYEHTSVTAKKYETNPE